MDSARVLSFSLLNVRYLFALPLALAEGLSAADETCTAEALNVAQRQTGLLKFHQKSSEDC